MDSRSEDKNTAEVTERTTHQGPSKRPPKSLLEVAGALVILGNMNVTDVWETGRVL